MNVLDTNTVNLRNIYGTAMGRTTGQIGTSANQTSSNFGGVGAVPTTQGEVSTNNALSVGGQANPVIGGIVFLVLIVGLSFISKRVGTVDEFKNFKVSPYNVLITTMAVIIGMPIFKYLAVRFPIPGVSTWVASA